MDLSAIIDEFNRRLERGKQQAGQGISDLFNGRVQEQQQPKAMPAPRDTSDSFVADLLRSARTAPDQKENIHKTLADIAERMTQVGPRSSPQTYEVVPQQPPPAVPTGRSLTDMFTPPKKPADWFQQMQQGQNAVITPQQRSNIHKELADIAERMAQGMVPEPIRARERASRTDPSAAAKPFTSEEVKGITPFVTAAAPIAFHGTPHTFDKFDASKIGTGQGAQSYGHGLYFAENPQVAKSYQQSVGGGWISTATPKAEGNMYQVNIPDQHAAKMLDWDKPLSEQAPEVKKALDKILPPSQRDPVIWGNNPTGEQIYRTALRSHLGLSGQSEDVVSSLLAKEGIPGIKYLDQGSRTAGQGTRNFVVFDPAILEDVTNTSKPVAKAAAAPSDWQGPAYRSESGYRHDKGQTAADVVNYEQQTLGNQLGVTDKILAELKNRPATDVVWVTKTKAAARRYGPPDLYDLPPGSRILATDPDGGFLVLRSKATP